MFGSYLDTSRGGLDPRVHDVASRNSGATTIPPFSSPFCLCVSFVFILLFAPVFFAKKAQRIIVLSVGLSSRWLNEVFFSNT